MHTDGVRPDDAEAVALFESGAEVSLEPCHHRSAVGPMAGVVSPSMWMFVLEDPATGRRAYCSLNEGLGKVLRYGAYSPEVLDRLNRELLNLSLPEPPFATMLYAQLDTRDGSLTFARAAHPHPLYVPAEGEPAYWHAAGTLLGVFESEFPVQQKKLNAGDVLDQLQRLV